MPHKPVIIPRPEHKISRELISENALKVLYRLHKAGYASYLVGGCVRDLLLGKKPKDFDVATDAHPDDIRQLFRNCRLIGRRFRLAHIRFGRDIIEVATFRGHHDPEGEGDNVNDSGIITHDNIYGSMEEDAYRRDFRLNALYYNIADFSVVDYVGGIEDLNQGVLRVIGDTNQRLQEDPVRILRAIRFAAKLDFKFDTELEQGIEKIAPLLAKISNARLFDEVIKILMSGYGVASYELLIKYNLLRYLFVETNRLIGQQNRYDQFIRHALHNTDVRVKADKPVNPAFLYSALLWPVVETHRNLFVSADITPLQALQTAGIEAIASCVDQIMIPKRFRYAMREIWNMQSRFEKRNGRQILKMLSLPRFRAAYDFFVLRAQSDKELEETATWWTNLTEANVETQNMMVNALNKQNAPKHKTKKRRRKKKSPDNE